MRVTSAAAAGLRRITDAPAWVWLGLGLALRVAFSLKLGTRLHQIDEGGADLAAWSLASTGLLGVEGRAVVVPPAPTAFFALFYLLGHNPIWPRLGQALVSTATAWMLGKMTEDISGSRAAGRLALAWGAIYPFFIYYSGMLLTETLYLASVVAGFWALCRCLRERGGTPAAAAAGFFLSLAALCRIEGGIIVLFLWPALAGLCAAGKLSPRAFATALLCWTLPLAGWAARNKNVTGSYVLDTHGGVTLVAASEFFELSEVDWGEGFKALAQDPSYQKILALPEAERDRLLRARALAYMLDHPGRTAAQAARKFVSFWRLYPRADKVYAETATSDPAAGLHRWMLVAISLAFEPWIILGGWYGFWALRKRLDELFPLAWFVTATMGLHMLSASQMRYRLPVMPFLAAAAFIALAKSLAPEEP